MRGGYNRGELVLIPMGTVRGRVRGRVRVRVRVWVRVRVREGLG